MNRPLDDFERNREDWWYCPGCGGTQFHYEETIEVLDGFHVCSVKCANQIEDEAEMAREDYTQDGEAQHPAQQHEVSK